MTCGVNRILNINCKTASRIRKPKKNVLNSAAFDLPLIKNDFDTHVEQ